MTSSSNTKTSLEEMQQHNWDELYPVQMHFIKEVQYTTYWVECATDGSDLVYHFFPTEEVKSGMYGNTSKFWLNTFAIAISDVAQEVFNASYPILQAAHVQEMDSWWLRAHGMVEIGDWEARNSMFYAKLDAKLEHLTAHIRSLLAKEHSSACG